MRCCDFCGATIGFYGCPKHGTDCYRPMCAACEALDMSDDCPCPCHLPDEVKR